MNLSEALCIVGLLAIFIYATVRISRIESTGPDRDELTTAEDLARIERDLADHGSFGRNLADREIV